MTTREEQVEALARLLHDEMWADGDGPMLHDWDNSGEGHREAARHRIRVLIESGLLNDQCYEQVGWLYRGRLFTEIVVEGESVPVFRKVAPGETKP